MLVAFAAGVANLWWMAALTALMVFEKTGRQGRRGVRRIGLGLIVLGLLMLASPAAGGRPWHDGDPVGATRLVVIAREADFTSSVRFGE
jgi:Predicted metal-binding integral membrane protein (DUF2182)